MAAEVFGERAARELSPRRDCPQPPVSTIEEPTAQEAPIARVLGYSSSGDALR
jgi:hypothetical protein